MVSILYDKTEEMPLSTIKKKVEEYIYEGE